MPVVLKLQLVWNAAFLNMNECKTLSPDGRILHTVRIHPVHRLYVYTALYMHGLSIGQMHMQRLEVNKQLGSQCEGKQLEKKTTTVT